MQLTQIKQLTGTLVLKTGLHIGAGDTEMRIGGTDNPVAKNPLDGRRRGQRTYSRYGIALPASRIAIA